jgi:hypothetical protein
MLAVGIREVGATPRWSSENLFYKRFSKERNFCADNFLVEYTTRGQTMLMKTFRFHANN